MNTVAGKKLDVSTIIKRLSTSNPEDQINYDRLQKVTNLPEIGRELRGCLTAQREATESVYHTASESLANIKIYQDTHECKLIPIIPKIPSSITTMSNAVQLRHIDNTLTLFSALIDHFAEEGVKYENLLISLSHDVKTLSTIDVSVPAYSNDNDTDVNFDLEEYNVLNTELEQTSDTIKTMSDNSLLISQGKDINMLSPPVSPVSEAAKKKKRDPKASVPQLSHVPGSLKPSRSHKQ